jgi:CheY-like chemotaxis protein
VGTTFKIYFPRVYRAAESAAARLHPEVYRGTETILLVEDHALLRKMTAAMMRGMGYTVLEHEDPQQAIDAASGYSGDIHLLVTDVVMPAMNGLELREKMSAMCPGIKTLLISGYSGDVISHYGDIGTASALLEKPFSTETLGLKLRELLQGK